MRVFFICILCFFCLPLFPAFSVWALDVEISEFLSNPIGDDASGEWIEVHNLSQQEIDLFGWSLVDTRGSPHQYIFEHQLIAPNQYQVFSRAQTGIVLNNDAESVVLSNQVGESFATPIDEQVIEGQSYAVVEDMWVHTNPSPGLENPIPSPTPTPTVSPTPSPTPSVSPSPTPTASPVASQSATPYAVALSEFHACDGPIEWVELRNYSDQFIQLDQWKIVDRSNQSRLLQGISIPSKGFVVKEWPAGFLNNSGDTISLVFDGQVIESFAYDTCVPTLTWAKNSNSVWQKTSHRTQGSENMFDEQEKQEEIVPSNIEEKSELFVSKSKTSAAVKKNIDVGARMKQVEFQLSYIPLQQTNLDHVQPQQQYRATVTPKSFASMIFLFATSLCFSGAMTIGAVTLPRMYAWYTVSI